MTRRYRIPVEDACPPFAVNRTVAARMLGLGYTSVWRLIKLGKLRVNADGRVPVSEIERRANVMAERKGARS